MTVSKSCRWQNSFRIRWPLAVLAGFACQPTQATEVMDTLQVHGFISQAWLISDANDFFGPSSEGGGSYQYTELGANLSFRPHPDVLVAAQVLSRRAGGETSDLRPVLDHGVIDYEWRSDNDRRLGVQVGRFKNPFGFYNQTRDVAFTRPSILLPQSIYFERTRSLALASDGFSLYDEEYLPSGTLRLQAGVGKPQAGSDLDDALGFGESPGSFDGRTSYIGQALYEHEGGHVTAALSAADVEAGYQNGEPGPGNGTFHFQPWILSLQYTEELWSLTAEYALRHIQLEGFANPRRGNARGNTDTIGESWYLQYTRRFQDDWQWLLRYDMLVNDRDDPSGTRFEAAGAGPAYTRYAKDLTTGIQWRIHPQVLLAAEYHTIEGTGWLPVSAGDTPPEKYWNLFLMQASFRF